MQLEHGPVEVPEEYPLFTLLIVIGVEVPGIKAMLVAANGVNPTQK